VVQNRLHPGKQSHFRHNSDRRRVKDRPLS
jgi:hypothetical protein